MARGREVNQIAMERRKRGSKVSQPRLQLVKPTVGALDGRMGGREGSERKEDGLRGTGMTEEEVWCFFSAPQAARDEQARAHAQLRVSRAMSLCPPKTIT